MGLLASDDEEKTASLRSPAAPLTPEKNFEAVELKKAVWDAVGQLPERSREVVLLFYFHDMSHGEIARFLDVSPSTILSHLHNARERLRDEMMPFVEESLGQKKLERRFTDKVMAALPILSLADEAKDKNYPMAPFWGLGTKQLAVLIGGITLLAGLIGWVVGRDMTADSSSEPLSPYGQGVRVQLATYEQTESLAKTSQSGKEARQKHGSMYHIDMITADQMGQLDTDKKDTLHVGYIAQLDDAERQRRLARQAQVVIIRQNWQGAWLINGQPVDFEALALGLKKAAAEGMARLVLQVDERTANGKVNRIIRHAYGAGFTTLVLGHSPGDYAPLDEKIETDTTLAWLPEKMKYEVLKAQLEWKNNLTAPMPLIVITPRPTPAGVDSTAAMRVEADQDGNMYLDEEKVTFYQGKLLQRLQEKRQLLGSYAAVQLESHQDTTYGQVLQMLFLIAEVGIGSISGF
jgi:biopolymer transport protein ExbD/DNA-binding CsgD family transcriptional regulator